MSQLLLNRFRLQRKQGIAPAVLSILQTAHRRVAKNRAARKEDCALADLTVMERETDLLTRHMDDAVDLADDAAGAGKPQPKFIWQLPKEPWPTKKTIVARRQRARQRLRSLV